MNTTEEKKVHPPNENQEESSKGIGKAKQEISPKDGLCSSEGRILTSGKPKFKLNKFHFQGAAAMMLVFAIAISALNFGTNLPFGTMFKGHEEAAGIALAATPDEIEARMDYAGEVFTLTGLPADELDNIKPEHIFLGGYLENLSVTGLEVNEDALLVTVGAGESTADGDEIDWDSYENSDALIAITPEAFKDKAFYYEGIVEVIYPKLISHTEAVAYDHDLNISDTITLYLDNDSFTKIIAKEDLEIAGGLKDFSIDNFVNNGNNITFTLNGGWDIESESDNIGFTVKGDKLAKGLDVQAAVDVGRVPMPYQSSKLCIMNKDTQVLDIFMDYDIFTPNINASMLTFGGVMDSFMISGFERVGDKSISITLTGKAEAGTGTVRFDAAAVASGRSGRVAEIVVVQPEIDVKYAFDTETPSFQVHFDGINPLEENDVAFEFDGALSGLEITNIIWGSLSVIFETQGNVQEGEGIIRVKGLYEAETVFNFASETPAIPDGLDEPDESDDLETPEESDALEEPDEPDEVDESDESEELSARDIGEGSQNLYLNMSNTISNSCEPSTLLGESGSKIELRPLAAAATMAILNFSYEVFLDSEYGIALSDWCEEYFGFELKTNEERLRNLSKGLKEISQKLDTIETQMGDNHYEVLARFDKLENEIEKLKIIDEHKRIRNLYTAYKNDCAVGGTKVFQDANLLYNPSMASTSMLHICALNVILDALNPANPDSMIHKYEQMLKSNIVPFEHNLVTAMLEYVAQVQAELDNAFMIVLTVCVYTHENGDDELNISLQSQVEPLIRKYKKVLDNIENHIIQSNAYKSYKKNLSVGSKGAKFELIDNRTTNKYFLMDPLNNEDACHSTTTAIAKTKVGGGRVENNKVRTGKSITRRDTNIATFYYFPVSPVIKEDGKTYGMQNGEKEIAVSEEFKKTIKQYQKSGEDLNAFLKKCLKLSYDKDAQSIWVQENIDYLYFSFVKTGWYFPPTVEYKMGTYTKDLKFEVLDSGRVWGHFQLSSDIKDYSPYDYAVLLSEIK